MEQLLASELPRLESQDYQLVSAAAGTIEARIAGLCAAAPTWSLRRRVPAEGTELADFLTLQDCSAYNIAGRIALLMPDLLAVAARAGSSDDDSVKATVAVLQLLQGCCLLHRSSRTMFARKRLLQPLVLAIQHRHAAVQEAAIETLPSVLVRHVEAIRLFEEIDGLRIVTDVFKKLETVKEIKLLIIGFLFFYMVPETRLGEPRPHGPVRKTTVDKQRLLGRYLSNVDGLVRELETSQPFGPIDIEW